MSDWYVLDAQRNVVGPVPLLEGARVFECSDRVVAKTKLPDCEVSTVFLGLDHRLTNKGRPLVFETLVFGGPFADQGDRYCTWAEAEAGHAKWVEKCQPIMTEGV